MTEQTCAVCADTAETTFDGDPLCELCAEDRQASATLRAALSQSVGAAPPRPALDDAANAIRQGVKRRRRNPVHRNIAAAAGWGRKAPKDDRRCCIEAAGGFMAFRQEPELTEDDEAMLMVLGHDWLGAIIGLVRAGPGALADGQRLTEYIDACPEVETKVDPGDKDLMATAFDLILPAWEAAGVVDQHRRLTALGAWVLPRGSAWAWHTDFDTGETIPGS